MKVSIIMSAYNAEKTIKRAIDSVLNQIYSNIELVIVNDCSTDNTLDIINSYSDKRIKVINHEINSGAGVSRDTGIKICTGEYIQFLDSDDYLSNNCISTFVNEVYNYNADIVVGGQIIESSKGEILNIQIPTKHYMYNKEDRMLPDEGMCKRFLNCFFVKKSLFNTIDYSHRRFVEDTPTVFKLLYLSDNVLIVPYAGYHYTQNENSLIHSASNVKFCIYHCLAAKDNIEFLKLNNEKVDYTIFLQKYKEIKRFTKKELLKFPKEIEEIENYFKSI